MMLEVLRKIWAWGEAKWRRTWITHSAGALLGALAMSAVMRVVLWWAYALPLPPGAGWTLGSIAAVGWFVAREGEQYVHAAFVDPQRAASKRQWTDRIGDVAGPIVACTVVGWVL
jgi:hypothetical protein